MKFAHEYEAALKQEGYPDSWVQSAISYRQLKKCIKKVQRELSSIGLDTETLEQLWRSLKRSNINGAPFQYKFEGKLTTFEPKLIFSVNPHTGIPVDASLSPETATYLQGLASRTAGKRNETLEISGANRSLTSNFLGTEVGDTGSDISEPPLNGPLNKLESGNCPPESVPVDYQKVEVPLRYDSEFFQILGLELSELHALQAREKSELTKEICKLGSDIGKLAAPPEGLAKTDMYAWREVLSLYTDSKIFFSTNERDDFRRDSSTAQKQLQYFSSKVRELKIARSFYRKGSQAVLERFLYINLALLRNLKFQELNSTAMTKILKKFDKRTALGARHALPDLISAKSLSSQSLAKALCYKISEEVLTVVPQLNDYLCPVCFNIAYKPVRLKCGHVFCIRCIIVMQRAKDDHCPLCRGSVVMQADSTNVDPALTNFLKRYFPVEAKHKQKDNERDSGIDQYGENYNNCIVM